MAREYLALADGLLHPPKPALVAIGGLSGSGKSTLAIAVAPSVGGAPGAVVLRSDETRKRLCGVPLTDHLAPEGYSPQVSERVYATLAERADLVLRAGHSVIVDAVHAQPADRASIERVASKAAVPFMGLWLQAPESLLIERAGRRTNDPSDADAAIVRMQHARRDRGPITWHPLDASQPAASVTAAALGHLHDQFAIAG
jgi:predicted kinase